MTTQNQQQDLPADPKLSEILRWNYCYTYVRSTMMQDTIHTIVRMNIDDSNLRMFAVDNSKKLFEVLAQYTMVQKDLNNSFTNYLKNVTLQMTGTDEIVLQAKGGLKSLLRLMNDAAYYFPYWRPTGGGSITEPGNYYIIYQRPDPKYNDRFLVTIELDPDQPYPVPYTNLPFPVMHLDGYTTVSADEKNSYWFTTTVNNITVYLTPEEGEKILTRQLSIDNLNLFECQNAWAAAYVKRNEFFGDMLAADKFIYTSQLAKFANLLIPLIDNSSNVKIYNPEQISPAPAKRQLTDTLIQFFTDLYALAGDKEQLITIEGSYSYQLMQGNSAAEQIVVTQPMLLEVLAPVDTTEAGIASFSGSLANAVTQWFVDQKPKYEQDNEKSRNGTFGFDLSIFSTIGTSGNKMPLLRLRNLSLPLDELDSVPSR